MNKIIAFSKRNFLEIIREPLSYIFCLGFPLIMLAVMTLVNDSIPPEADMTIFRTDNLAGGIAVFGLMFVMLFTALTVAKDRSGAFLIRLYTTTMKSGDFLAGYMIPMVLLAVIQCVITFIASYIVSLVTSVSMNPLEMLSAVAALIPSMILMVSFGMLFGTIFNEKSSPGLCSIIISLGSFLGGIWFDAEAAGGVLTDICNALPFYHAVKAARLACVGAYTGEFFSHIAITSVWAAGIAVISVTAFKSKMKADLN